jgi:hypothetical protein
MACHGAPWSPPLQIPNFAASDRDEALQALELGLLDGGAAVAGYEQSFCIPYLCSKDVTPTVALLHICRPPAPVLPAKYLAKPDDPHAWMRYLNGGTLPYVENKGARPACYQLHTGSMSCKMISSKLLPREGTLARHEQAIQLPVDIARGRPSLRALHPTHKLFRADS